MWPFKKRNSQPDAVRRFDGAAGGRRAGSMGTFHRVNPEIAAAGPTLVARAAYLAVNNPFINQAVANWTGALVGPGIMPNARHPDVDTRNVLNAYFQQWWDRADLEGRTDFAGLQEALARSMIVAGEGVALLVQTDEGPRIRVIDAALIDTAQSDGNTKFQGVEVDAETGRRTTYWLLPARPDDVYATAALSQPVDAENVLHVFRPIGPGQIRGASWLAPIILPASDFDLYCDALLKSAQTSAMVAGFIVNQNGGDTGAMEETPTWEPGALVRLGFGEDVKFSSPAQLQQADAFLKHNLRALAAGLGLPQHLLDGDLSGANYSSLRAGLLPFRQRVEQCQYNVMVPQFLAPCWRAVILHGILSGELDAPNFGENPDAYLRADWLPPKPMQVDPAKDVEATVAELDAGLTSRRKAVAERGWVLEDLEAEIAAETPRANTSKNKAESKSEQNGDD
ncbi:phage portal protein [Agrobacterium pusense]|uniref:phage portal protein n=1 Tax=Agrobacterium pusense TaxID=648995 RepID=UPI000D1AF33C|nr:phage portal protein [Agrobacterium pusense]